MKRIVKIMALALAIVTLATLLVSCGGLSGKYKNLTTSFEFKGSKVIIDVLGLGLDIEGKYEIKDDKISFEFDTDDIDNTVAKAAVEEFNDIEFDFEKGDDYIKIGGVKYTKAD